MHTISSDRTYSSVTQGGSAVIIQPKHTQKTSETKANIFKNVNPVDAEIEISGVKNIRNGGVLIGSSDAANLNKFKKLVSEKLGEDYEVKEVTKFNPKVRISGFSEKLSEDELVKCLRQQNKSLLSKNFQCKVLIIQSLKKRTDIFQAVVQIDMESYNNVMSAGRGKLFLGYDICDVYDAIDLKRCFNCCGFSHYSKLCKSDQPYCPRCADTHSLKDCKASQLNCINCIKSNQERNTNFNTKHAAWDSNCFLYLDKIKEFKASLFFPK